MARKKRTVESAQPVVSDVPKLPALTQEELLRLRLASTDRRLAQQEQRSGQLEREVLLARIDPQRQLAALDNKVVTARSREMSLAKEYEEVLERASARLGIDLKKGVTVNAETGEVTRHEKQE